MRVRAFDLILFVGSLAWGAETPSWSKPGFLDADRDGLNDRFRDANGDGIDDVSGNPYPHKFKYEDKDGDRRNDLFRDEDGDGVNDLAGTKPGVLLVLDHEGKKVNDITGARYTRTKLYGDAFGRIKEDAALARSFVDRDMDGINDVFVDKDGDGICDGRALSRSSMPMGQGMGCASDQKEPRR